MKDEINKIIQSISDFYKLDNALKYYLDRHKAQILLDYITNLQEKLEVSQTNEETYRLEMEDITKCLGLDEDAIFDEVKEYATNLQEENERWVYKYQHDLTDKQWEIEDYKSRNEKAIEYIKEHQDMVEWIHIPSWELLNILQGSDE